MKVSTKMQTEKHEITGINGALCPFLGFSDDPSTALSYPSQDNCCHKAKPCMSVALAQQRRHCLSVDYPNCLVYKQQKVESFPNALRGHFQGMTKPQPWRYISALVGVSLLGLIASLLLGIFKIPGLEGMAIIKSVTPFPTILIPSKTASIPQVSPTLTGEVRQTATMTTVPPTALVPHFLETPIGDFPQLIIHQLKEGDGYILLSQTYNTTENAIKAVNFNLPEVLIAGKVLIIPVNSKAVQGLPQFSAYEIIEEGLTIEQLAGSLKMDSSLLQKYNSLPDGYVFEKGEWLLIPH